MPDISTVNNPSGDPRLLRQAAGDDLNPAAAFKNRGKQPLDRRGVPLPIRKSGYDALDKNSFLKLLVTQLSKQDPTNPMNDREFISQMAQFSSLEQMNNVANSMLKLRGAQANQLIGKMVQGKDFVTDKPIQGIATSVVYSPNGDVLLKVNGRHIKIDDISEVTEVRPDPTPGPSSFKGGEQFVAPLPNVSRETPAINAASPLKTGSQGDAAAQKRAEQNSAAAAYLENSTNGVIGSTKNITVPKGE